MSQEKKDGPEVPGEDGKALPELAKPTADPLALPLSAPIDDTARDTRDRVTFSTTFIEDVDLLAKYHMDYQLLMAMQDKENECHNLTFPNLLQSLRNVVESYDYLYKKQFSIPDHLVAIKFICSDGEFYLGLNNGYPCLFKDPHAKDRIPFPLVEGPLSQEIRRSN